MRLPRRVARRSVVFVAVALLLVVAAVAVVRHVVHREQTRTVHASADAYVSTAHAMQNYGREPWLRVSHTPRITSFLRFDVGSSGAPVVRAVLRLASGSAHVDGLQVRDVVDGSWQENGLTAADAPPSGPPLPVFAATSGGWASVDVTALVAGQRSLDVALTTLAATPTRFHSRESSTPPQLVLTSGTAAAAGTPADSLARMVENVAGATGKRYAVRDSAGASMDALKIVGDPGGGYLGVYHTTEAGVLVARVATSTDLLRWARRAVIDQHASQPTVSVLADRGVLVAEEADSNGSRGARTWLRLRHYPTVADLLAARPDRTMDLPHTLAPERGAEGTPDIRSVLLRPDLGRSAIEIGFHYLAAGQVDRPAIGILTDFTRWDARPDADLSTAFAHDGVTGSIGDRDTVVLHDQRLALVEARVSSDAGWQVYLDDDLRGDVHRLDIRTHGRSRAFANPSATLVRAPSGAAALVVTLFVPLSGAAPGEAGELVYFTEVGPRPASTDPVIAAAGDIACTVASQPPPANDCAQAKTAQVVQSLAPTAVLALGDEQYEQGTLDQFLDSYDATWGEFRTITYPAPGNHEYDSRGAAGYYTYFGPAAGKPSQGWYSFDLGSWHLVSLNSDCANVGGCEAGSPQERWLAADLAAHPAACTLAYWHEPRFSSGQHGDNTSFAALWQDLYAAGADIVLVGHDHDYERFAPQNPAGQRDPQHGIRQFVVGTGGKSEREFLKQTAFNSEVRHTGTFGVLRLDLHANGYQWRFLRASGPSFADSGSGRCHGAGPASGSATG